MTEQKRLPRWRALLLQWAPPAEVTGHAFTVVGASSALVAVISAATGTLTETTVRVCVTMALSALVCGLLSWTTRRSYEDSTADMRLVTEVAISRAFAIGSHEQAAMAQLRALGERRAVDAAVCVLGTLDDKARSVRDRELVSVCAFLTRDVMRRKGLRVAAPTDRELADTDARWQRLHAMAGDDPVDFLVTAITSLVRPPPSY